MLKVWSLILFVPELGKPHGRGLGFTPFGVVLEF